MRQVAKAKLSKDQLNRIVRTIIMHDVAPQMGARLIEKPIESCKATMNVLKLNFVGQYDQREAEDTIFKVIMER